jgi:hypothetical protein
MTFDRHLPIFAPGAERTDDNLVTDVFKWATVIDTDPFRIRLDADPDSLPIIPSTLVPPRASLAIGDRVWVQIHGRRIIVLGRSGGPEALEVVKLGDDPDFQWVGSFTHASSDNDIPRIYAAGRRVQASGRIKANPVGVFGTTYTPFTFPERFAPAVGYGWIGATIQVVNGGSTVGPEFLSFIGRNGSGQPVLNLSLKASQTVSWTTGTWIMFDAQWFRDYPTPTPS